MGIDKSLIRNYPRVVAEIRDKEWYLAEMLEEEALLLADIVERYVDSIYVPSLKSIISEKVFDHKTFEVLIDIVRAAKQYDLTRFEGWGARGDELTLELMNEGVEIKEGDEGEKRVVEYRLDKDCLGTIVYALIAWLKSPIDVITTSTNIPLFAIKPAVTVPVIGVNTVINGRMGLMQKLIWHEVADNVFVGTIPQSVFGMPGEIFELYLILEKSKCNMEVRTFGFNIVKAYKLWR